MPTIEQNSEFWNEDYDWSRHGDEWSEAWGGAEAQWFGVILPRIRSFLPAGTILEIAPGFGRWTQFLKDYCERLIIVDLSDRCIAACKHRFSRAANIEYHVNDGVSLQFISDQTVDLAFSFDSLVHAEADVLEGYVRQLGTKLSPNGAAFIHHSNVGSLVDPVSGAFPDDFDNRHWRSVTVSAARFEAFCEASKLQCISQEKINWGQEHLNDALSVAARRSSVWSRPNRILENPDFMREAEYIRKLSHLYTIRRHPVSPE